MVLLHPIHFQPPGATHTQFPQLDSSKVGEVPEISILKDTKINSKYAPRKVNLHKCIHCIKEISL